MPGRLPRRAPGAVVAAVATGALALATATPGLALPAGPAAAHGAAVGAHRRPAAPDLRADAPTSSLAGTTETNLGEITGRHARIDAPGEGATTFAVVLVAAGAMLAGAGAGFAGGRRGTLRGH